MLDQRRRRWADVVQMLYICFVFAVMEHPTTLKTLNHGEQRVFGFEIIMNALVSSFRFGRGP